MSLFHDDKCFNFYLLVEKESRVILVVQGENKEIKNIKQLLGAEAAKGETLDF